MPYDLRGPQVEPAAGYWSECHVVCHVTQGDIDRAIEQIDAYPPEGSEQERKEIVDLRRIRQHSE